MDVSESILDKILDFRHQVELVCLAFTRVPGGSGIVIAGDSGLCGCAHRALFTDIFKVDPERLI